jgi:transposase
MSKIRFVGLDVHAETIAIAVAEVGSEEIRWLGKIPNREDSIRRLVRKLGRAEDLRVCYEAGPTGYVLYWQLTALGVKCEVVAPTLVPVKSGDRVKTDRKDALKLARCYRAGDLTPVWVPDAAQEALRDVVRAREAAKRDQLRARHRLSKFLLRHGRRAPLGIKAWTDGYRNWIQQQVHFEQPAQEAVFWDYVHEVEHAAARIERLEQAVTEAVRSAPVALRKVIDALQSLRGIAEITAATMVAEVGSIARFQKARQLMAYSGVVPSEHSSGERIRQGGITKTGNAHLRRVLLEAAWAYRHPPRIGVTLRRRQRFVSEEVKEIAWKAQHRLHGRYRKLLGRGKNQQQTVTAIARELLGFIWAIGRHVEGETQRSNQQAA